jgi:hypothetical protein
MIRALRPSVKASIARDVDYAIMAESTSTFTPVTYTRRQEGMLEVVAIGEWQVRYKESQDGC